MRCTKFLGAALLSLALSFAAGCNPSPSFADGILTPAATAPSLKVQDIDGIPAANVNTLKFTNGTVTDNADGTATVTISGTGTVTSVDAANGVETASGSAITTTGTIRGAELVNAQTGTTYTYLTGDRGKLVTHTNVAAIAGTLPQASASFPSGWYLDVQNRGAGTLTITPTTSTIDGAASLALTQNQGVRIVSDGTNYFSMRGIGSSSGAPSTATYITQTADGGLSAEQALGALATGCMASATTTGVVATRTITGTANEVTVTNGDCSAVPTFSLASTLVLTGKAVSLQDNNLTIQDNLDTSKILALQLSGLTTATTRTLTIPDVSGTVALTTSNVSTATALAANGANCSAGSYALGVDASGAAEGCTVASGSGTVTVVGAGALTSTALVTGGGTTTAQTPSATATLDASGNISTPGSISTGAGGTTAGAMELGQGTAPSAGTTSVKLYAPASVTSYIMNLPAASATGFLLGTDATNVNTMSFVGFSGTGNVVRVTSPTMVTPTIGVATATSINKMAITSPATSSTLAVADGKTLTSSNTLTLAGTDSTTITFQATDTYVGRATTDTLTNKTLDAEGTGNVLTIPRRIWLPAAGCSGTTAGSVWDLMVTTGAVAACVTTPTNVQQGFLDFADGATVYQAQTTYALPTTWTGTVDARIKWLTSATAGDVVWQLATICVADAETNDPAFNTASTVTDTAKGTTNQKNDAAITTVTVTGCAAGELMHVKILRDPAHASDTLAATARLISVELVIREAI